MTPEKSHEFMWAPDLTLASELICGAWRRPCWNYDVGLLEGYVNRPTSDADMTLGVKTDDGRLVSFQGFLPHELEYYGRSYRSLFGSFATISAEQRLGLSSLAHKMLDMLVERANERGYELFFTMIEVGTIANRTIRLFRKYGLDFKIINVFGYRASLRNLVEPLLPASPSPKTRIYEKADKPAILPLIESMGASLPLRKIIPEEDVDFVLTDRPHSRTYVYVDKDIRALANVLLFEVLEEDGSKTPNVYFENINLGDLDAGEQHLFLGDILYSLNDTGYHAVFNPDIGLVDQTVFTGYRFRLAPRQLNLYVVPLQPDILPEGIKEVDSFFLDVY